MKDLGYVLASVILNVLGQLGQLTPGLYRQVGAEYGALGNAGHNACHLQQSGPGGLFQGLPG